MSDTSKTVEEVLTALQTRADEHATSKHEADREYAAGIRDAITALKPLPPLAGNSATGTKAA